MKRINLDILKNDERAGLSLRELYYDAGYRQFKMSRFEEYDFYTRNMNSLNSGGVITFTDTDGKLMALKPDVTLSIIKNFKNAGVDKYFYNESVFRISDDSKSYREIMQTGLECIGDISDAEVNEVLSLALDSLSLLSEHYRLCVSSNDLVPSLLADYGVEDKDGNIVLSVREKNMHLLAQCLDGDALRAFSTLIDLPPDADRAFDVLRSVAKSDASLAAIEKLRSAVDSLDSVKRANVIVDFAFISNVDYYNGVVFKGFINQLPTAIISGGCYDRLMSRMNKCGKGVGFAVYLDGLALVKEDAGTPDAFVNVALPKGRLGEKVYDMFERAGYGCPAIRENTRKLVYENAEAGVRFFWVKPSDVSIYVERGAADLGVCGKDIILEYAPDVYELLDLGIGKCRMAVAAKNGFTDDEGRTLRVATKFSEIAKNFYKQKGRDIDIIHLNGSIELAPLLGLSDVIVDIVETGKTLLENDLSPIETVMPITARLIAGKSAYSFKRERIEKIKKDIAENA